MLTIEQARRLNEQQRKEHERRKPPAPPKLQNLPNTPEELVKKLKGGEELCPTHHN